MGKKIIFTENQVKSLANELVKEDNDKTITIGKKFKGSEFTFDKLKSAHFEWPIDVKSYCAYSGLQCLGRGIGRTVYAIDDKFVIKVSNSFSDKQNKKEVETFLRLNDDFKEYVPVVFDYDREHDFPFWIVTEQVLEAKYSDFPKLLGIDFGSYNSSSEVKQMRDDMEAYKKYDGHDWKPYLPNLMEFLEDYQEGNIGLDNDYMYSKVMKSNAFLKTIYDMMEENVVSPWEIELIQNWGLVYRNGESKLVILDIGI